MSTDLRKKILLKGPLLTRSGYGEQARFALRSLRSREDLFDIYIQPLNWGQTSWLTLQDEERVWIDQTIEKTINHNQNRGSYDMSLQVTIPNEWSKLAPVNVGYTAGIETNMVAPAWLGFGNDMDKIIVVSDHSKNVYINSKAILANEETNEKTEYRLNTPVVSVNYPVKHYESLPELDLGLSTDFNFLAIAQFGPRKNLVNTIKWFVEEFQNDNVGLVVKSNMAKNCLMDREQLHGILKGLLGSLPESVCKVYLLHGNLSDEEIHSLYVNKQISAFVALPHGEGFGLPIFEAAYSGLPIVATTWSGQSDFLISKDEKLAYCYEVACDINRVQPEVLWENVIIKESSWSYAREQSAKEKMRQCYNDITTNKEDSIASKAPAWAATLTKNFSEEKKYEEFCKAVYDEPGETVKGHNENEIIL